MTKLIDPLSIQVPIVDNEGKPTPQFMRVLSKLAISGDLTQSGTGSIGVADNAITDAKLADMATLLIKARKAGTTGDPQNCTITEIIDFITGTPARGDILYRGASAWQRLAAGTAGKVLQSNGAGTDPTWVTPTGGAPSTPTVRNSNIQSSSNTTYTVTWPTGTIAGDIVIIHGGHGFAWNNPAGWTILDNTAGSNWNEATWYKVMTAGDISTGSVTITSAGAFNGVLIATTVIGTGVKWLKWPIAVVRSSGGVTSASMQNTTAWPTDLVLCFGTTRGAIATTFSSNIASLVNINATGASGALGKMNTWPIFGMKDETLNFASAGTGYASAIICMQGV